MFYNMFSNFFDWHYLSAIFTVKKCCAILRS